MVYFMGNPTKTRWFGVLLLFGEILIWIHCEAPYMSPHATTIDYDMSQYYGESDVYIYKDMYIYTHLDEFNVCSLVLRMGS